MTSTSDDGLLTLTVPVGAMAADTALHIAEVDPTTVAELADAVVVGPVYRLEPAGLQFSMPVFVEREVALDTVDSRAIVPLIISDGDVEIATSHELNPAEDPDAVLQSFELEHFSILATVEVINVDVEPRRFDSDMTVGESETAWVEWSADTRVTNGTLTEDNLAFRRLWSSWSPDFVSVTDLGSSDNQFSDSAFSGRSEALITCNRSTRDAVRVWHVVALEFPFADVLRSILRLGSDEELTAPGGAVVETARIVGIWGSWRIGCAPPGEAPVDTGDPGSASDDSSSNPEAPRTEPCRLDPSDVSRPSIGETGNAVVSVGGPVTEGLDAREIGLTILTMVDAGDLCLEDLIGLVDGGEPSAVMFAAINRAAESVRTGGAP